MRRVRSLYAVARNSDAHEGGAVHPRADVGDNGCRPQHGVCLIMTTSLSPPAPSRPGSPLSPFRHRAFAVVWTAVLVSNIGIWMQNAAAGWLMTSLDPDPRIVAMVQVATALPIFLFGVPAGALSKSVEQFNEFAVSGVDEQFHRGETPWDRVTALLFGAHEDGPNRCLGVIDQGPYYAVRVVVTDLGTKGGLVTDADARVLRPDGSVIEGLYASGNTMAPALGRIYPGAGGPIGSAMVFSYLAALDMAADDKAERS